MAQSAFFLRHAVLSAFAINGTMAVQSTSDVQAGSFHRTLIAGSVALSSEANPDSVASAFRLLSRNRPRAVCSGVARSNRRHATSLPEVSKFEETQNYPAAQHHSRNANAVKEKASR
jgi:hypothetical protein